MSEQEWMHVYGLIGVIALIVALLPYLKSYVGTWSTKRRSEKIREIEASLASFEKQATEDLHAQRLFRAFLSRGLVWLATGVAVNAWAQGLEAEFPMVRHIAFSFASLCFGISVGSFVALTRRMSDLLFPDRTIARLRARLEKLH